MNQPNEHSETSTVQIAQQANVSNKTVFNVIKNDLLYPYHVQSVQEWLSTDYPLLIPILLPLLETCHYELS